MFGATDWALKRVFKFLLKRHLGRLLRSEVDLEQLDVQLGTGTLELRSVLLNCDHLNEQLGSSFWEITAGYVGSVKATIPITSLHSDSCTAELDEVLITVKARMAAATAQPSGHSAEPAELAGAASSAFEVDDLGLGGPATITDGVKLIAGGIEKVLQQLQLKAHRIAVRVELPNPNGREGPAALVVLRLEHFSYAGESSPPLQAPIPVGQAASLQLLKVISFEGLTVELFEDVQEAAETDGLLGQLEEALTTQSMLETGELPPYALDDFAIGETASTASRSDSSPGSGDDTQHVIICSNDGIGCAGQLKLLLTWHGTYHLHPHISADLQLEPLQVQFHPHHLPLLADLVNCVSAAAKQAADQRPPPTGSAGVATSPNLGHLGHSYNPDLAASGTRSFIEGLFLPDCDRLVADALSWSGLGSPAGAAGPSTRSSSGRSPNAQYGSRGVYPEQLSPGMGPNAPRRQASATAQHGPNATGLHAGPAASVSQSRTDEFFDCDFVLGSFRNSFSSFVSTTAASLRGSEAGAAAGAAGPSAAGTAQHDEEPLGWQIRASTSELSFVLWYPDPEQHAQQAQHEAQHPSQPTNDAAHAMSRNDQARPDNARTSSSTTASIKGNAAQNVCPDADPSLPYRARFSVECGDLSLALASTGKDLSCSLQLYRLEAVEHIAAQGAGVYSAAAALAELTRLPEVLPMSAYGPRPVPSFTGVSILPLRRSLYSSTLSQLSCMSASAGPVSPSSPQVQVWPVLCCAGGRRAEASVPSLSLSLQVGSGPDVGSGPATPSHSRPTSAGSGRLGYPHRPGSASPRRQSQTGTGSTAAAARVGDPTNPNTGYAPLGRTHSSDSNRSQSSGASRMRSWRTPNAAGGGGNAAAAKSMATEAASRELQGEGDARAKLDLRLATVWLSFPLLQRLQSFFEPLLSMTAASIPARPATPPPAPKVSSKAAVARAIDSILDDLQEFRPEEPRPRFGGFGGSVKVDVSAPHVCAIVLLSPGSAGSNSDSKSSALPTSSHGYSYLAIDVFESEDDNAALPMISLRSGDAASPSGVAPPAGAMVEAEVAVGRAKVYLVGCSHGSEGSPRQPAQPRRLQANCVLDVVPAHHPSDAAPGPALSADLRWSPSATASPLLIHDAWDHVQSRSGSAKGGGAAGGAAGQENAHLDSVQFQESAIAASGMYLHVRAVEVLIDLSQADLAALWHLADAYLRWRAQTVAAALNASNDLHSDGFDSLAAVVPSQCAILLEGGFRCNLRHGPQGTQVDMGARDGAVFLVDAAQVRVFSVSSLGSSVDAGTTSVFCQGVSVANGDTRASLLYCPPESCSTSSRSCPCIEVLHVQRAIDLATSRHPTRTFTLGAETEALGAACIRGTTFATDEGDLALSWVSRLIGFFAVNYAEEAAEEAPTTITSWSVNLQDVAVRYEPPSFLSEPPATPSSPSTPPAPPMTDPVAAVLLLGFLHWHTPAAETHPEVELRSLSLFVAQLASRGAAWAACTAQDVPQCRLHEAGYACVAQEGAIQIIIKAEADNDGLWELEVQNQRLYSPLSKAGLKHLLALAAQWAAQYADEPGAGAHEELEADRDGRDSRVGSGQGAQRAGRSSSSGRSRRTPRGSSVGATTPVRVMDGVEEDAFRREPTATQDLAASVFLDGGWYEDGIMHSAAHSVAHSTQSAGPGIPVILEDFFVPDALGSDCTSTFGEDMELEERGIWYGNEEDENAPPSVNDDHFPTPTEEEVQAARMGGALGRGALGPLPEGFPAPVLRITLRDIKCVVALCRADEPGSPTASHAGRIELDVTGLCVQADTFAPADQYARRTAVSIHHLEIRDCAVWPDAGSGWRRMLSLHTNMRTPRDASACMFQAELEAVRPSAGAGSGAEEYRLHVSLLPLRVRLDQNVVTFLQAFFSDPSARLGPPEADLLDTESEAGSAAADDEGGSFFQRCEIRPFSVVVDYRPRHVDVAALRAGNLAEVLNLVPWGGVALDLPHVKLTGLHGWAALGAAVGTDYLKDVASSQAHKFVVGVAPIRSVCKVGSAAAQLFAIPADSLRAAPNRSDVSFSRQMRRSLTGFVRAVTLEALGLGASVAGGAHLVLQGGVGSTSDQPAGMAEGLRQAASKMSSGLESAAAALVYRPVRSIQGGEGVGTAVVRALRAAPAAAVAPLSAAADAARAALLGARNALDPERYEERRS